MDTTTLLPGKFDDGELQPKGGTIVELVEQLSGFFRRQFPILILVTICALAFGLLYLFTTPARYTAHTLLVIDSSKGNVLQQESPLADVPVDTAQVETQVELLKSENVGLSVIKDQHLTEDPEFVASGGGLIGAVFRLIGTVAGSGQSASDFELTRRALERLIAQRSVTRVGRTYVLDIAFTSLSRDHAAKIANAIADSYIVDQLEAKYQTTKRASTWLQDRIAELRTQALSADRAVLDYKEKNNIVDIGAASVDGPASGSRLLGEQQLADLNAQLTSARAATAEAEARLERIQDLMKRDVPDAAVSDALHSEVITRLRNQYLELSEREAIWSQRYGPEHLATVNLRTQMAEIRHSISGELGRIAESYKSDYEIAKSRQESLQKSLASSVQQSQVTNRDRLGLRALESSAQAYHTIYDNFLQRYMEAIQQQSFPITQARVISAATPPLGKSSPIGLFVLGVSIALGLILGTAAAVLREAVDRVFRSSRQIEETLRVNCLAVLPSLADVKPNENTAPAKEKRMWDRALPGRKILALNPATHRQYLHYVVDEPLSAFAEAFRNIKVAADISQSIKDNRVIGITSTLPHEGKSTVSCNLAQLMAHAGKKVILIDGDLRNPSLTRALTPDAEIGFIEVLSGKVALADASYVDERTGLVTLPAVVKTRLPHTNEILASDAFKRLIDALRKHYDYILVDLPPLAPVVDVRATTGVIDSYIYVVEWGKTRMNIVQHQLESAPGVVERLLGVVLNKANVNVLGRYESYYGRYYYKQYYGRYGYGYSHTS